MNTLIKNVRVIDAFQDFYGEIYVENGIVKEIGININKKNVNIIDGNGKILMPAFVDTHAHFREPGLTHKETIKSGSMAAVKGGYTMACLMANTYPICSTKEIRDIVLEKNKEANLIDVHQCVSVTTGFNGKTLEHLKEFYGDDKVKAISDDGVGVMDSATMMQAMNIAKENNWVLMSHAEDSTFSKIDMRIAENLMTERDIYLAKESKARLHMCHVSTKEAIKYITDAKMEGVNVTCEVTPHHIALTQDESNYRVNPPIREKEDVEAIVQAIKTGIVDCIGTDHAPHTKEDKEKGAPGMVGLETAFSICYTKLVKENGISLNKLSELMSKKGSEILGINKGTISVGKDADFVLVDLENLIKVESEKFYSKGKNTPFEGKEYFGEVLMTIKAGNIVYKK